MRVGIEATIALVPQKTGVERYASELITALIKELSANPELDLFLYFHTGNPFTDRQALDQYRPLFAGARCRVYSLRRGYGLALSAMARLDRLQLLHLLEPRAPHFKPCPILLTIHDVSWAHLPAEGRQIEWARQLPRTKSAIDFADNFLAVSQHTARDFQELYGVAAERIPVVQHGVDHALNPGRPKANSAARYNLGPYILHVGALQYRKNLVRLLEAYKLLKTQYQLAHTLVLAGRDGHGSDEVYRAIENLGLQQNVRLLGYVPEEDLPGLYAGAGLFVYPSIYEGFGIPIIEAFSCGTVVAAARSSSIPEVGGDAIIYFDPYNVNEMAAAIYEGLTNPSLRDNLQEKGRRRVARFTWQRAARETISVYGDLVAAASK